MGTLCIPNSIDVKMEHRYSQEMMDHFQVSLVCHGSTEVKPDTDGADPYALPRALGKFATVDSGR